MSDKFLEKRLSDEIDKLVNDSFYPNQSKEQMDYQDALGMAKKLINLDFSRESKLRQATRDKLMNEIRNQATGLPQTDERDGELDDDQLRKVAGGLSIHLELGGCAVCDCTKPRAMMKPGEVICSVCGHPRDSHS